MNLVFFLVCKFKNNGPSWVAKEGVEWATVGKRFTCKVGACDVSYIAKYLL